MFPKQYKQELKKIFVVIVEIVEIQLTIGNVVQIFMQQLTMFDNKI